MASWSLQEERLVCITTDNGSNVVKAASLNNWTRVQCFGHRLHLAIDESHCIFFKKGKMLFFFYADCVNVCEYFVIDKNSNIPTVVNFCYSVDGTKTKNFTCVL